MSTEVAPTVALPTSSKVTKVTKAKSAKTKVSLASHPPFASMIREAILALKEKGGSSQLAILKYLLATHPLGSDARRVNAHLRLALRRGVKAGVLLQPKGPSGRVKLSGKVGKPNGPVMGVAGSGSGVAKKQEGKKAKATTTTSASRTKKPAGRKTVTKGPKKLAKSPGKSPKKAAKTSPVKAKSPKKSAVKPAPAAVVKPKKSPKKAAPKSKKVVKK